MTIIERALKKVQTSEGASTTPKASGPSTPAAQPTAGDFGQALHSAETISFDLPELREAGLASPESSMRVTMHQFRRIRRPLVSNAFGRDAAAVPAGRLIAVSSALPGEGKTFTSYNLAVSLSLERDAQVLLVDADVAKRSLSNALGLANRPGLLEVLGGQVDRIETVVVATDMPGLFVLPSGPLREDASELVESVRLKSLFLEFLEQYPNCIVVFDTAPLLLTSESRAVAHLAGQNILVIKSGSTPKESVVEALAGLPSDQKYVAAILNQCAPSEDQEVMYGNYYPAQPSPTR